MNSPSKLVNNYHKIYFLQYFKRCVHFIHQRQFTKLLPQQVLATGHEYGGDVLLDHPEYHLLHSPIPSRSTVTPSKTPTEKSEKKRD